MVRQGGLHHDPSPEVDTPHPAPKGTAAKSIASGGCFYFESFESALKRISDYENNLSITLPSRTKVIGRPVLVSYSSVGSTP